MDYFSEYAANGLWNSNDISPVPSGDPGDSNSAPELQSAALNRLIEDKEIAAKAVAIVIGSSRRGVVALCAEMAELLKAKRSLERQVSRLQAENKALRNGHSSGSSQADVCNNSVRSESGRTSGYHSRPAVVEVHAPASRPASNPSFLELSKVPAGARRRHRSVQWPVVARDTEQDEVASLREDVRTALRANAAVVTELMETKRELSQLKGFGSEGGCRVCQAGEVSEVPEARAAPASPSKVSLLGCACRQCFLLRRQGCPRRLLQLPLNSSNHFLRIKDLIRLNDGRRGRVRYLGHVDTDPNMDTTIVWIGVELDESAGGGDGKVGHKRYFSCRTGHAAFVQLAAVAAVEEAAFNTVYISDYI